MYVRGALVDQHVAGGDKLDHVAVKLDDAKLVRAEDGAGDAVSRRRRVHLPQHITGAVTEPSRSLQSKKGRYSKSKKSWFGPKTVP